MNSPQPIAIVTLSATPADWLLPKIAHRAISLWSFLQRGANRFTPPPFTCREKGARADEYMNRVELLLFIPDTHNNLYNTENFIKNQKNEKN
jgi:hypothetical protein